MLLTIIGLNFTHSRQSTEVFQVWSFILERVHNRENELLAAPCRSVRVYQRGSHLTDFREVWYWLLLWNSVGKFQFGLKSDKNIGHFTRRRKSVYCCWRHKFTIRALLCNSKYFCINNDMQLNNTQRIVAFLLQQCLRERGTMLRYTSFAYLMNHPNGLFTIGVTCTWPYFKIWNLHDE